MRAGLFISTSIVGDGDRSRFDPARSGCSNHSGQRSAAIAPATSRRSDVPTTSKMPAFIDTHLVDEPLRMRPPSARDWCALLAVSLSVPAIWYGAVAWVAS